jgi:hypothetical protein
MVIYDLVTFTSFIFLTVITVILRFGFTFFSDSSLSPSSSDPVILYHFRIQGVAQALHTVQQSCVYILK